MDDAVIGLFGDGSKLQMVLELYRKMLMSIGHAGELDVAELDLAED